METELETVSATWVNWDYPMSAPDTEHTVVDFAMLCLPEQTVNQSVL